MWRLADGGAWWVRKAVGMSDDEVPWWAEKSCFFLCDVFFVWRATFAYCRQSIDDKTCDGSCTMGDNATDEMKRLSVVEVEASRIQSSLLYVTRLLTDRM